MSAGNKERRQAASVLTMNTLAFTVCFAVWVLNGVLVTYLVENKIFAFDQVQVGWLLGIPVLSGSVLRLPLGMLTDRFGGRIMFPIIMLLSAAACLYLSTATTYGGFLLGSLGFGLAGTGFAIGIAYTSLWFGKDRQGTALGVFGAGNAGSAVTSMGAPALLAWITAGGTHPEGWRQLPRIYAASLLVMTVVFLIFTHGRKPVRARPVTVREQLALLRHVRVWRFGLYYFLVFGGFVALAQWLIPYYVSVYGTSLAVAGLLASIFSLPSGLIRALGGWMSDRLGARRTLYWVLGCCAVGCLLLTIPRMEISSPGESISAGRGGVVTAVSATEIVAGGATYKLRAQTAAPAAISDTPSADEPWALLPHAVSWQEPVVKVGDKVKRKQLLARGITHISFQANIAVFTALVFVVGIAMGIGKAAVYKFIPDYFPNDVGVVGGIVGVLGGLGGFVCPILFGYLLRATGIWTTCFMFFLLLSLASLVWLHAVVTRLERRRDLYPEGMDPSIPVLPAALIKESPVAVAQAAR